MVQQDDEPRLPLRVLPAGREGYLRCAEYKFLHGLEGLPRDAIGRGRRRTAQRVHHDPRRDCGILAQLVVQANIKFG